MKKEIVIHWFRQDLRLSDNPALTFVANLSLPVLPIYILDDINSGSYRMGNAARYWLHHSLASLNKSLDSSLCTYHGDPQDILDDIITRFNVRAISWNRCYEPWRVKRDSLIQQKLKTQGIEVYTYNGSLLWEPQDIKKDDGTPYKVFTPFYKKGCLNASKPRIPLKKPDNVKYFIDNQCSNIVEILKKCEINISQHWQIGEAHAKKQFDQFMSQGLYNYKEGRNIPSKPYVSRMSPYLHFGEISPNQLWYLVRNTENDKNIDHFCSELGWREFSYNLLFHNPELPYKNLQSKFDNFPWENNEKLLHAWQQGKTGIPMVDAGMRELLNTGYMHNRVRMIVGSFLVKNLFIHWHHGERWFWDKLVDADLANNSASWQWIAGCGADAAPYFRIFNPITQGQKFDPEAQYIRKYIPEISQLNDEYIFNPSKTPPLILKSANLKLGEHYPLPIVDIKHSRDRALESFKNLKT